MNPIEDLMTKLTRHFPQLSARVDPPAVPDGSWWLDLNLSGHSATAEWRPGRGFGVLSSESDSYGEGPDEIYPDVASTFKRLKALLERRERTAPPARSVLRTLRESRSMSQEELAEQLSVGQSAISKLERRADVHLSTLRHFVAALGGVLELHARFPDRIVKLDDSDSSSEVAFTPSAPRRSPRRGRTGRHGGVLRR
jgi:DNA-binding XRE family transcriptional regulator